MTGAQELVARILAETAVTKDPRRFGFERSERYTVDAVRAIVDRTWRSFLVEVEALRYTGLFTRLGNPPHHSPDDLGEALGVGGGADRQIHDQGGTL